MHQADRVLRVYDDFVAERRLAGSAAATGRCEGNKKPDINIGLELARQAGNSEWADLTLGIRQKRSCFFLSVSPA
jgi:hypothetical protein